MSEELKHRTVEIIRILTEKYPDATVTLDYDNPFQLLISTILAAQSTDVKVNEVTKTLYKKYRTPEDFANANPAELEQDIHATGFYHQKARSIIETSQDIINQFGGRVPGTMEELTNLRGVGRKTANVVLGNAFGIPGVIVDTHMLRVSARLGLVNREDAAKKNAVKVERQLMEIVPHKEWTHFSNLILFLGRDICTARTPRHTECPLLHLCPTGQAAIHTPRK
ncbi:MAG TPA: endonuclease III [Armatimonadetes bacterium]|nr:endonuclease III [Armatimonadota bacterium]